MMKLPASILLEQLSNGSLAENTTTIVGAVVTGIALLVAISQRFVIINPVVTLAIAFLFAPVYLAAWLVSCKSKSIQPFRYLNRPFIKWTPNQELGVETGRIFVPLDYKDPAKGSFALNLVKSSAPSPKGTIVFIQGGPAIQTAKNFLDGEFDLTGILPKWYWDNFDIIMMDERGTGSSNPKLVCSDAAWNTLTSVEKTDPRNQKFGKEYADSCGKELIKYISIDAMVDDINSIRQAINVDKLDFIGVSWGAGLGGAWVSKYPETVGRVILTSSVLFNTPWINHLETQINKLQISFAKFINWCRAKGPDCPLNALGDPQAVFDELTKRLEANPVQREDGSTINKSSLLQTMLALNYFDEDDTRTAFAQVLADAYNGQVEALGESEGLGDWIDFMGSPLHTQLLHVSSQSALPTQSDLDALYNRLLTTAPLFASNAIDITPNFSKDTYAPAVIGTDKAPQILIIAYKNEGMAPFEDSLKLQADIKDSVLVVEQDPTANHGVLDQTPAVEQISHEYMLGKNLPAGVMNL